MRALVVVWTVLFTIAEVAEAKKRLCLTDCYASGALGSPLYVPNNCRRVEQNDCEIKIAVNYYDRTYTATYGTSFIESYNRFLYIATSYDKPYLSYTITYSCQDHNYCAFEFAVNKMPELANKTYNAVQLKNELAPLLAEIRPPSSSLLCSNEQSCAGLCLIDYDQKGNKVRESQCKATDNVSRVTVYDGGSYTSLDVSCNRTGCNTVQTVEQVKQILYRFNLTDANGRISGTTDIAVLSTVLFAFCLLLHF